MRLMQILWKKEYIFYLALIFTYLFIIINYFDIIISKSFKTLLLITLFILISFLLYCIILESEFENIFLKILQIKLEQIKLFILIIIIIFAVINLSFAQFNLEKYFYYLTFCPFTSKGLDYKLHLRRRCELYNINKKSVYPFKYIFIWWK